MRLVASVLHRVNSIHVDFWEANVVTHFSMRLWDSSMDNCVFSRNYTWLFRSYTWGWSQETLNLL